MKKKTLFYTGIVGLAVFEILKVYFIMPMPGSQQHDTLDVAYFLHTHRWWFRVLFLGLILFGAVDAFQGKRKWLPAIPLAIMLYIVYTFNFQMLADKMFKQPENLAFKSKANNILTDSSLVIGVSHNNEAK